MKSRLFNDLAGLAGVAYSAASGVREEIKTAAKNQLDSLSSHMDLVPRSELDIVEELALRAKQESDSLKEQLAKMQETVIELQERITMLEETVTDI